MPHQYTELCRMCPRSFLFAVVANVGPGCESRPLAVAYRQGDNSMEDGTHLQRVEHFAADTLALIEILSDPANRAPLEAETAIAREWFWRTQRDHDKARFTPRPSVPDSVQPAYVPWKKRRESSQPQPRAQLPWHDDAPNQFPFATACLLLGLLGGKGDDDNRRSRTRPGDVQLQPLSTVFMGKCIEYGLVVVDISDLNSGVKYGIAAFPVRCMADVQYKSDSRGWDSGQDPTPEKEPDVVLFSPRPRRLLSIHQWLSRYFHDDNLNLANNATLCRLDNMPRLGTAGLDYIWPRIIKPYMTTFGDSPQSSWGDVICDILNILIQSLKMVICIKKPSSTIPPAGMTTNPILSDPSRGTSFDHIEDYLATAASSVSISDDQPQHISEELDRVIDELLILTHQPDEHPLEKAAVDNLQIVSRFPEQLREQLEEAPFRLGPFKVSSHVLAIAYAGRSHLNWAAFFHLTPNVITAALASDEVQGASALSLGTDQFGLDSGGDLKELTAAMSKCTGLRQLCLFQTSNRHSDDSPANCYSELLLLWRRKTVEEEGHSDWLQRKTIHATCAFSTSLRGSECLTWSSTITRSLASSHAPILPIMHIFMFGHHQNRHGPDIATDNVQAYQNFYAIENTLLDGESFAIRFLAYLSTLSSGSEPDKAILQFAYPGPASPLSDSLGVLPIPAGFFNYNFSPNGPSKFKLSDIHPGSWMVLVGSSKQISDHTQTVVDTPSKPCGPPRLDSPREYHADTRQRSANTDREGRTSRHSDDTVVLDTDGVIQYSIVRIGQGPPETIEQDQRIPDHADSRVQVVGGLTDFLRETAPEADLPAWEKRIGEMQIGLRAPRDSVGTEKLYLEIGTMSESRTRDLLTRQGLL